MKNIKVPEEVYFFSGQHRRERTEKKKQKKLQLLERQADETEFYHISIVTAIRLVYLWKKTALSHGKDYSPL